MFEQALAESVGKEVALGVYNYNTEQKRCM